jgi:hypothetical protein
MPAPDDSPAADAPPATVPAPRWWLSPRILLIGLIALHALLLTWSALVNSVAFDEYAHLPAGISYWRYGKFDVYNLSPPLLRMWAAAPVMLARPDVPPYEDYPGMLPKDRHWTFAEAFLRINDERYHRLFLLGRLAMIPLSCLGAWVVYRWAAALYGGAAGLGACAVYVLCPNLCAHASLVGTDAGTSVTILLAAWLWWQFCRGGGGSWKMFAFAAVAIAAAHLSKFSALLLWPMLLAIAICVTRAHRKRVAAAFAGLVVACIVLVNASYGFQGSGTRAGDYVPRSGALTNVLRTLPPRMPVPLPQPMILGFDAQKWEFEQGLASLLFGEMYRGSKWYYYPVALALKVPLATWALLAIALLQRRRPWTRDELAVAAAAAVFLLGAMLLAGADLGVRYVLPALPLAFVLVGRARTAAPRHRWIVPALLAILALENLSAAPRYLTYFNLLAGGQGRGQLILNDSNFDWGQGLIDLKKWMRQNKVPRVQLGYFGRVDPHIYGIDYDLLTKVSGEPYIAISSYFLTGLPHRLPSSRGPTGSVRLNFAPQLRAKPRVAIVGGGTIHIFRREHVAEAMQEARAAGDR